MALECVRGEGSPDAVLVRGLFDDLEVSSGAALDPALLKARNFSGRPGETLFLEGPAGLELLVGLGARATLDAEALRRAGAGIARAAAHLEEVVVELGPLERVEEEAAWSALAEGAGLGAYRFDAYRAESKHSLGRLVLSGGDDAAAERAIRRAAAVVRAVSLARDLVNTPARDMGPEDFADRARAVAEECGLSIEVLDEQQISAAEMGGLLGVAAGAERPPRFVKLTYEPASGTGPTVALVGKGVTFDSGGLSLKPAASMMTMKTDMSGAAAVLATMSICAELAIATRVVGYMPLTENMPGGAATRPGDVLKIRNGKTIEVLNTDAEGRLILADALSLAVEEGADAIVDLATLTGACVVALGKEIAGLLGNDDRLIAQLRRAGASAGEALWPLPLPKGYRSHIDSEIADMKNIGATGQAGALSAALLLAEFVGELPWAHLDIAGPARSEEDRGYRQKGATGFGVRTLVALLERYEALGGVAEAGAEGIEVLR